mmetsp:Transcript_37682/g.86973  ORF Transcript_37682/g.86973 Transcript_37682/m.86973 type:complete len:1094 (+) Transcript_37682:59-3340(+)
MFSAASDAEQSVAEATRARDEQQDANTRPAELRFRELAGHINEGLATVARDVNQLSRFHELQMSVLKSQLRHFREMHGSGSNQSMTESDLEESSGGFQQKQVAEALRAAAAGIRAQASEMTTSGSKADVHGVTFSYQSETVPHRPSTRERREQYLRSRTQSSVMGALATTTTVTSEKRRLCIEDAEEVSEGEEEKRDGERAALEKKNLPHASSSTGRKRLAMREGYVQQRAGVPRHLPPGNGTRTLRRMSSEATLMDALIVSRTTTFAAMGPDSVVRRLLDLMGVLITLVDIIVLPVMVAWEADEAWSFWIIRLAVRSFYTLDIPMNFVTAYRSKEQKLEIRIHMTALHYLRGWFFLDLVVIAMDWCSMVYKHWLPPFVFAMRLIRQVPRFGAKFVGLFWALKRKINLPSAELFVDVLLITSAIILFNHLITCVWYIIGRHSSEFNDTGRTWLSEVLDRPASFGSSDADQAVTTHQYEYFTGMHWAFTQMTPGSMEVVPASTIERVYNIVVLIFGLIVGTGLTATLTSMMTQQRLAFEVRANRRAQLEQYLSQEQVSRSLSLLIKKEVNGRYRERPRIKMKDVQDLSLVSTSLREELTYHIYATCLCTYPLFQLLDTVDQSITGSFCSKVIQIMDLVPGDILFEEFAQGDALFFVSNGMLRYHPGLSCPEAAWSMGDSRLRLERHTWCSEPALWTIWLHLGTVHAVLTTEVLCVSAEAFQAELRNHSAVEDIAGEYCRAFHQYYKSACVQWSDIGTGTDHNDVLSGMSRRARLALAEPILVSIKERFRHTRAEKIMNLIREELATGACYVCMQNDEVLRTVLVVSLRLRSENANVYQDRYLVQLGEIRGSSVIAECRFPGTKRREQETSFDAIKRFVQTYFTSVADGIQLEVDETETMIFIKDSPRYGIRTRYLRTTFNAVLLSNTSELETLSLRNGASLLDEEHNALSSEGSHAPSNARCCATWWSSGRRSRAVSETTASMSMSAQLFAFGAKSPEAAPSLGKRRSSFFFEEDRPNGAQVSKKAARESAQGVLLSKDEAVLLRDRNNVLIFLWLTEEEQAALANPDVSSLVQTFVQNVAAQAKQESEFEIAL